MTSTAGELTVWSAQLASFDVTVWAAAPAGLPPAGWSVERSDGGVRVVVVGAPPPACPAAGHSSAVWAAPGARVAARSTVGPAEALDAARTVWPSGAMPAWHPDVPAAAIADVARGEFALQVRAAAAAGCEVWVLCSRGWWCVAGGATPLGGRRARNAARTSGDPPRTPAGRPAAEPMCRSRRAAVQHDGLVVSEGEVRSVSEVVVANAGAQLDRTVFRDLGAHLAAVAGGPHGDVTAIQVSRR